MKGVDLAEAQLNGKRVAIIAADMVEQVELLEPRKALEAAGAKTELVSLKPGTIKGFNHFDPADDHEVEKLVEEAGPDQLRADENVVQSTRAFFEQGKPVAAICHGPSVLVEAGVVNGRRVTSWPSLQTDIRNAGGNCVEEEVVVDRGLVTGRKPDDIPVFSAKMVEEFAEGVHARQRESVS